MVIDLLSSPTVEIALSIFTLLLGINGYFIRGLVVKIDRTEKASWEALQKVVALEQDFLDMKEFFKTITPHISQIDSDVAVLKFAILKQIKKIESREA